MTERFALVTDTLHFVGLATARALREDGVTVLCHDASFDNADERAKFAVENPDLIAAHGLSEDDLRAEVKERFARLDILVNNDAFPAFRMPMGEADIGKVRDTMEALFIRPYALTSALMPFFKEQKSGSIIFVTSAGPIGGIKNYTPYAAARGAVNAMIRSLSLELASDNITVNAVAPNYVESPTYFPKELMEDPEKAAKILKNIPLRRLGKPEEVAALIRFLASDEAGFITGQIFPIAGGWV